MYPARSSNWWLGTSASAGFSRSVGMNNLLQSIVLEGESSILALAQADLDSRRLVWRARIAAEARTVDPASDAKIRFLSADMKIAIAADHAGFVLKEKLRHTLAEEGHDVVDFGPGNAESCDYPDYAQPVARDVAQGRSDRGILVCSTGIGMAMAANKVNGVRAAPAMCEETVRLTREHNDCNVLTIGARYTDETQAAGLIHIFLDTEFAGGRHARRVAKI